MKMAARRLQVHVVVGLVLMVAGPAYAALLPSSTDLWQFTNFVATPSNSGVHPVSDIRNMFGGNFGIVETDSTLFRDFVPAGTIHTVAWETSSDQTVRSIGFFANHDASAVSRGVSRFSLFGEDLDNGNAEVKLFEVFPSNPYGATPGNNAGGGFLSLDEDIATPIRAKKYRAEFVQFGNGIFGGSSGGPDSGPRIHELDAYSTFLDGSGGGGGVIPEPASFVLMGMGLAGLGLRRRRNRGKLGGVRNSIV